MKREPFIDHISSIARENEIVERPYSWDPKPPEGWTYRTGINRNGNRYRGFFPPRGVVAAPIWLQAYYPYGNPSLYGGLGNTSQSISWNSGDPSEGDALEAMYFDVPNMM